MFFSFHHQKSHPLSLFPYHLLTLPPLAFWLSIRTCFLRSAVTGGGNGILSSVLAWRTPWTEKPGRLQSMGWQTVGHNWTTNTGERSEVSPWGPAPPCRGPVVHAASPKGWACPADSSEAASPEDSIYKERFWGPVPPWLLGLVRRARPARPEWGARSLWKTGQIQVPGQRPSLVHLPVHCFSLSVQKRVQGELGSIASKTGGGVEGLTANKTPGPPPALCQNHFRYPETGVSGYWLHSGLQRGLFPARGLALGVWHALVTSSTSGTHIYLSHVLDAGRTEQPCPGPWRLLSFLKKHKTLEIHVLYDGEKKST